MSNAKNIVATILFALGAGLLAGAVAPSAGAWSSTLQYTCSGPGFGSAPSYTFAAVMDTDVPETLPYGSERATSWETYLFAPESFRAWAVSQGYTTLYAGIIVGTSVNGAVQPQMSQSTPSIAVPTTQQTWSWHTKPTTTTVSASTLGDHVLGVTSLAVTVAFHDADGPRLATSATCILDPATPAAATVVDSYEVVAASTTTTVAVTGDIATATVTSNGTPPVGIVYFSVIGRSVASAVSAGKATAKLPTVPSGNYELLARFVPSQTTQLTSSTGTAAYTVRPIATRTFVLASYRPGDNVVKARARVTALGRSDVSGRLTFVLKRNGATLHHVTVRLAGEGVAVKKFRRIMRPGRYVVVAKYLGTGTFQRSSDRVRLTLA